MDGDIDIIGGVQKGNELVWWRNDKLTFLKQVVATDVIMAHSLYTSDTDKDGDLDLFSTSNNDISWWEKQQK